MASSDLGIRWRFCRGLWYQQLMAFFVALDLRVYSGPIKAFLSIRWDGSEWGRGGCNTVNLSPLTLVSDHRSNKMCHQGFLGSELSQESVTSSHKLYLIRIFYKSHSKSILKSFSNDTWWSTEKWIQVSLQTLRCLRWPYLDFLNLWWRSFLLLYSLVDRLCVWSL